VFRAAGLEGALSRSVRELSNPRSIFSKTVQTGFWKVGMFSIAANRGSLEMGHRARRGNGHDAQKTAAGGVGIVFMNLSSETETHLRGRQPSVTPGRAANKVLGFVGVPQLEETPFRLLSTWTHYLCARPGPSSVDAAFVFRAVDSGCASALLDRVGNRADTASSARTHATVLEMGREGSGDRSVGITWYLQSARSSAGQRWEPSEDISLSPQLPVERGSLCW
jgi:hypothetical protein